MEQLIKTHEDLKMNAFGLAETAEIATESEARNARQLRREASAAETALLAFETAHPEVLAEEDRLRRKQADAAFEDLRTGRRID